LTPDELSQINLVARTSGNDAILDALLLRLHSETACRRGGALGLRLADLDVERGLVRLREKAGVMRWQPITLDLATALGEHAQLRGALLPIDALLRFRRGQALTSRRYDHLWNRIGHELPWVAAQGISTHWLRHTTLTCPASESSHLRGTFQYVDRAIGRNKSDLCVAGRRTFSPDVETLCRRAV
jgi:integrase